MKKFLLILGIIAIAGGVFVGGVVVGTRQDFMNSMFQVSALDQQLVDASKVFYGLLRLDDGDSAGANAWLNQELNSHIVTIDQFMKDCPNPETKEHARTLLARIATHRQAHPSRIDISKDVPGYVAVEKRVQSVLEDVLKREDKQNQPSEATR